MADGKIELSACDSVPASEYALLKIAEELPKLTAAFQSLAATVQDHHWRIDKLEEGVAQQRYYDATGHCE